MGNHIKYSRLNAALIGLKRSPDEMEQLAKESLDGKEYMIFQNRYWKEKKSLEEVGKLYGCSRERIRIKELGIIRKIEERALRRSFEKDFLRGYRQLFYEVVRAISTAEVIVDEKKVIEPTEYARTRIDGLELSVRSHNCLKTMGIGTLGELAQKTEWDMLGYPNLGRKSLAELADVLEKYDLGFGMKPEKLLQETNIAKKTYVMKKENLERIQHLKKSLLNNILGKKLGDFELPKNFIYFYKNKTLGEIARKTEQEMLQEPLIGKAHMRTIGGLLKKYGLEFGMKIQD